MIIFLIVLACIFGYAFMGGLIGGRHHALKSSKCHYKNCWGDSWCGHIYASVYMFGMLWPFAIPVAAGTLLGATTKETRTEKRRTHELEEAKHQAELARLRRIEDDELDRQLSKKALR